MKKLLALLILVTAGSVIGAGIILRRHPGIMTVMAMSGFLKPPQPLAEVQKFSFAGHTNEVLRYEGNANSSKRSAVVFHGLTHHAENHPSLRNFIGALSPHYRNTYVPVLPGMKIYSLESGKKDVHGALKTLGGNLEDYDAFAFCVAGSFLTEALAVTPPLHMPRNVFLHSPLYDGQRVFEYYGHTQNEKLDAASLLILAANSDAFKSAENGRILGVLNSLPAGETAFSAVIGALDNELHGKIFAKHGWQNKFLQEYDLRTTVNRKISTRFYVLVSENDRVIPHSEGIALCAALKRNNDCEIRVGSAGGHSGGSRTNIITEMFSLADFFMRVIK